MKVEEFTVNLQVKTMSHVATVSGLEVVFDRDNSVLFEQQGNLLVLRRARVDGFSSIFTSFCTWNKDFKSSEKNLIAAAALAMGIHTFKVASSLVTLVREEVSTEVVVEVVVEREVRHATSWSGATHALSGYADRDMPRPRRMW